VIIRLCCVICAPYNPNPSCNSHDRVGIDFKGVQMVINYDLPQTAVAYIHRIGKPCCGTVVLCVCG
jgi:hypothetical protein